MLPVTLRGVALGEGRPKICVPLTGATTKDLIEEIRQVKATRADLVEWRADYFDVGTDCDPILAASGELRNALGDMPLLFTFRTVREGGQKDIDSEHYLRLNLLMMETGNIDAVDVELFEGDLAVGQVVEAAHRRGIKVVVSSHDFHRTPDKLEIFARLGRMRQLGGDIPKLAAMPICFADVLTLMAATDEYRQSADCPVITMSMGQLGRISRAAGRFYGSALTFGTVKRASAPGQLTVEELCTVLDVL